MRNLLHLETNGGDPDAGPFTDDDLYDGASSQAPPQRTIEEHDAADPGGRPGAQPPAGIDYDDPGFQSAVEQAAQRQLDNLLESAMAQDQEAQFDEQGQELIDPDVLRYLDQRVERMLGAQLGQIQPTVQAFEDQQNMELVNQWTQAEPAIQEAQKMLGEGDDAPSAANLVQFAATGYIADLEDRYGPGERATRTALRMAADQVKQTANAAFQAGYQARNAELHGHVQTRAPAPGGPMEAAVLEDEPKDELEAMDRIMARNGNG